MDVERIVEDARGKLRELEEACSRQPLERFGVVLQGIGLEPTKASDVLAFACLNHAAEHGERHCDSMLAVTSAFADLVSPNPSSPDGVSLSKVFALNAAEASGHVVVARTLAKALALRDNGVAIQAMQEIEA